ncbi:MAG: DUF2851 family protein [Chitinophagales bacterium]
MTEHLLHYIWQYQLFSKSDLLTKSGKRFTVLHPGFYNTQSGADFFHARLQFEDAVLAGNVELHIRQNDWEKHQHQRDAAYNNTILHVVYEAAETNSPLQNGYTVETLELKDRLDDHMLWRYEQLMAQQQKMPCEKQFPDYADSERFTLFLERLNIERLEQKVRHLQQMLQQSKFHWDEVAYKLIATYLGAPVNKEPMLQLTLAAPLLLVAKCCEEKQRLEALLFGQAGLLEGNWEEDYPKQLRDEYRYLKRLHHLDSMDGSCWKFMRMRPASFPVLRIAELAALLYRNAFFFTDILESDSREKILQLFQVSLHGYWQHHARFGQPLARPLTQLGSATRDSLLINAVAPLLFVYGKRYDEERKCELALDLLRHTPPENNSVIRHFKQMGVRISSAQNSQALLQLQQHYCDKKRCLYCDVGRKIILQK